jgi:hypothetical protein
MKLGMLASLAALTGACAVAACLTVPADATLGVDAPFSSEAAFGPVADYLNHRCGSLDCHGSLSRNLRIYGCQGMRVSADDVPICNPNMFGRPTTPDEHKETYLSLVGLEPTTMSAVVADHGGDPDLLTFVRKARGEESHKGGALIVPGDDQDVCITSWLAGATDTTACGSAQSQPSFPATMQN